MRDYRAILYVVSPLSVTMATYSPVRPRKHPVNRGDEDRLGMVTSCRRYVDSVHGV